MTLADITIEKLKKSEIEDKYKDLLSKQWGLLTRCCCFDPRYELKEAKRKDQMNTLVDFEYVSALAQFALEMHLTYIQ